MWMEADISTKMVNQCLPYNWYDNSSKTRLLCILIFCFYFPDVRFLCGWLQQQRAHVRLLILSVHSFEWLMYSISIHTCQWISYPINLRFFFVRSTLYMYWNMLFWDLCSCLL
jgi:hypothetical protein